METLIFKKVTTEFDEESQLIKQQLADEDEKESNSLILEGGKKSRS